MFEFRFGIYAILSRSRLAMTEIHLAKARRDSRYHLSWMTAMGSLQSEIQEVTLSQWRRFTWAQILRDAQDDNLDGSYPLLPF